MVGSRFGLWSRIKRVAASDTISGLIMLGFALVGLLLANIPVTSHLFESIAETHMAVPYTNIDLPLGHWAQDGLLTIFFLVVGLDLKQELTTGSLANPKAAAVPMACAVGGMAVPPLLFLLVTWLFSAFGPPAPGLEIVASGAVHPFSAISQGWAIPMATDIAFSLTVLALFAKGLPGSIRAFLMTLATVDDLLAVIVIALFFSSLNAWYWFLGIVVCAAVWAYLVRRRRVPWPVVVIVGALAWVMMFEAGVHPTLAGMLVGLLTPSREMHGETSPRAERYKEKLQPFSALLALPIFALFATGVHFEALSPAMMVSPVVLGIVAALVIGKPLGIMITAWLATHPIGLSLPKGLRVRDLFPAACACGIGFTVSFLLATLAYDDPELSGEARFGVLVGSLISAMVAGLLLNHQARGFRSRAAERELAEAARKAAGADANIEEVLADGSITISMKALSPEAIRRYRERHPERFATEEGSSSEEERRTTTVKPGSRHISRLKRRMRELGKGSGKATGSKRGRGHRR
ncbi:sodium:proton antiporter [Bifidobacterium margollesii]|uniref:Na(+)/H(+) antiporter NhaA n=1 Tax=Bifidobacterium margollesii TaxID=2020964 RepID=A0A2N5J8C5_9BIFI|nr:sodium:proton antiporter [Bifidobacterium margollesii]